MRSVILFLSSTGVSGSDSVSFIYDSDSVSFLTYNHFDTLTHAFYDFVNLIFIKINCCVFNSRSLCFAQLCHCSVVIL